MSSYDEAILGKSSYDPDEVACYNEIVLQISQTKGKNK